MDDFRFSVMFNLFEINETVPLEKLSSDTVKHWSFVFLFLSHTHLKHINFSICKYLFSHLGETCYYFFHAERVQLPKFWGVLNIFDPLKYSIWDLGKSFNERFSLIKLC